MSKAYPSPGIDLRPDHWIIVRDVLRRYVPDRRVLVFGSRAGWTAKEYSDLDLAILGDEPLSLSTSAALAEGFVESDLPFKVDLVDWANIDETFRDIIRRDGVNVQAPLERSSALGLAQQSVNYGWHHMPFTEAVVVNPKVRLECGMTYPFVDMATVDAGFRCVHAVDQRAFSGSGSRFQDGDTLMARITPCLENGKIARYCTDRPSVNAHGSTEFIVIRGRPGVTDSDYAYYLTQWEEVRSYAIGQMTGTSGRQRVPVNSLGHLSVPVPSLPEQRAIASILGVLDDKIQLNRRMNRTLEAMARAIFKDWFVDFGPVRAKMEGRDTGLPREIDNLFPDQLVDSELGQVPEGWSIAILGDIAVSPRLAVDPARISSDTPYIGLGHMPRRSVALADWDTAGSVSSGKFSFENRDILFGKLRPYFHKVGIAPVEGVCSTDIVVLRARAPLWSAFVLACVSSSDFVAYVSQTSTGTRMPRTSWNTMNKYQICRPDNAVSAALQHVVSPMLDRIITNVNESRILTYLRKALLPKLISGQVRIPDIENLVGGLVRQG